MESADNTADHQEMVGVKAGNHTYAGAEID
jgi:hypothetical protein